MRTIEVFRNWRLADVRRSRTCVMILLAMQVFVGSFGIRYGLAIGPTLPIEFVDQNRDRWTVGLRVRTDLVRVIRVERQIYIDGARSRVEPIEVKFDTQRNYRKGESQAQVSLRFQGMESIAERGFAQKIVVEGQWLNQPGPKPLSVQRWFYFVVREGKLDRVDAEGYSKVVDVSQTIRDSSGRQVPVHTGKDVKGDVPLPNTKGTPAIPVGPRGGAIEERVPSRGKEAPSQTDRSEANEK